MFFCHLYVCSVAFCIYRHVCCQCLCAFSCAHCLCVVCFYSVGFQCLLVVTVTQHPSVKLVSYCDDCSINPGAHRGFFESSSLFIVSLVGHWTLHQCCVPICLVKRSVCRWLIKLIIDLSLIAHSCRPKHLSPVHVGSKTSSSQVQGQNGVSVKKNVPKTKRENKLILQSDMQHKWHRWFQINTDVKLKRCQIHTWHQWEMSPMRYTYG